MASPWLPFRNHTPTWVTKDTFLPSSMDDPFKDLRQLSCTPNTVLQAKYSNFLQIFTWCIFKDVSHIMWLRSSAHCSLISWNNPLPCFRFSTLINAAYNWIVFSVITTRQWQILNSFNEATRYDHVEHFFCILYQHNKYFEPSHWTLQISPKDFISISSHSFSLLRALSASTVLC